MNRPNYIPSARADLDVWLDKTAAYSRACALAGGDLLDHMRTVDLVADMDLIRAALGESSINFYGYSYGTYLAQVYATRHPDRVHRMVLDGVDEPGYGFVQATAFDDNLDAFFDWVARHDAVYHLGTRRSEVRSTWYRTRDTLQNTPALGLVGPDEWTDAFISAGYGVTWWANIARDFAAAVNDDNWAPMVTRYQHLFGSGPGSDNWYAAYLATRCTDSRWPSTPADLAKARAIHRKHPFLTWYNTWFNAPCLSWAGEVGRLPRIDGRQVPPILLVNETYDGATPIDIALRVRREFPRSVLVEGVDGRTHATSMSGVTCVDDSIAAYLADGTLPPRRPGQRRSDLACPRVPEPEPPRG